tara:strand:- start:5699 stop:8413 length:2715 start_codon:yes stop_codon:yes gene_type:complete
MQIINLNDATLETLRAKGLNSDNALNDSDKIGVIDNYRGGEQYRVIISEESEIVGMASAKRRKAQLIYYGEIHDLVGTVKDPQKIQNIKDAVKEKFDIYTGSDNHGEEFNEVEQVDNQIIKLARCILENSDKAVDGAKKDDLVRGYRAGNKAPPTALANITYDSDLGYGTSNHLMYCYIKSRDESNRIGYLDNDPSLGDFNGYEISDQITKDAEKSIEKINNVLTDLNVTKKNDLFFDIQALSRAGEGNVRGIGRSLEARVKVYKYFENPQEVENVNSLLGLLGTDKELNKSDIITMYLALSRVAQKASALVGSGKRLDEMELDTLDSPLTIMDGVEGTSIDAQEPEVNKGTRRKPVDKKVAPTIDFNRLSNLMQQTTHVDLKTFNDDDAVSNYGDDNPAVLDDVYVGLEEVAADHDAAGSVDDVLGGVAGSIASVESDQDKENNDVRGFVDQLAEGAHHASPTEYTVERASTGAAAAGATPFDNKRAGAGRTVENTNPSGEVREVTQNLHADLGDADIMRSQELEKKTGERVQHGAGDDDVRSQSSYLDEGSDDAAGTGLEGGARVVSKDFDNLHGSATIGSGTTKEGGISAQKPGATGEGSSTGAAAERGKGQGIDTIYHSIDDQAVKRSLIGAETNNQYELSSSSLGTTFSKRRTSTESTLGKEVKKFIDKIKEIKFITDEELRLLDRLKDFKKETTFTKWSNFSKSSKSKGSDSRDKLTNDVRLALNDFRLDGVDNIGTNGTSILASNRKRLFDSQSESLEAGAILRQEARKDQNAVAFSPWIEPQDIRTQFSSRPIPLSPERASAKFSRRKYGARQPSQEDKGLKTPTGKTPKQERGVVDIQSPPAAGALGTKVAHDQRRVQSSDPDKTQPVNPSPTRVSLEQRGSASQVDSSSHGLAI